MPCYHPLEAYRFNDGSHVHKSGKARLYFGDQNNLKYFPESSHSAEILTLPCGKCVGCLLRRSADWAMRCIHEARYHDANTFLTLTYATKHLPPHRSLRKRDLTLFFKKLRHHTDKPLKYFACGEYGDKRGRPHYHAIVFGHQFSDLELCQQNENAAYPLYTSAELSTIWTLGDAKVGSVTDESADYVARYTLKKNYGNKKKADPNKIEPYAVMSKGIGKEYYKEFKSDMYPSDYIIHERTKQRRTIPRYYDKQLDKEDPEAFQQLKLQRRNAITPERQADFTTERLEIREQSRLLKIKALQRTYDP